MPEVFQFRDFTVQIERKRNYRRLTLRVDPTGILKVRSSLRLPIKQVEGFLLENIQWIQNTQEKHLALKQKYPQKKYLTGENFFFFGEPYKLEILNSHELATGVNVNRENKKIVINHTTSTLHPIQCEKGLRNYYSTVGKHFMAKRIQVLSQQMQLFPKKVSFRSQKSRWGSCSARGGLNLNWRLTIAPPEVIDYVIIHELAHLKHFNHSPAFWELVSNFAPNFKSCSQWLKTHRFEADFLAVKSELYC